MSFHKSLTLSTQLLDTGKDLTVFSLDMQHFSDVHICCNIKLNLYNSIHPGTTRYFEHLESIVFFDFG